MVIADADGRIVYWNDAAERFFGYAAGRPWASRSTSSFREPSLQLAGEDSNLQPPDPKSGVLPLNYPPGWSGAHAIGPAPDARGGWWRVARAGSVSSSWVR